MKYYQFDEDVIAVRSVIIEAETEEEATKTFADIPEEYFNYEVYESVSVRVSQHLFKPQLD